MRKVISSIFIILFTVLSCIYMLNYKVPMKIENKARYNVSDKTEEKSAKVEEVKEDNNVDKNNEAQDVKEGELYIPPQVNYFHNYPVQEYKSVFKVSKDSMEISNQEKLQLVLIYKKLNSSDEKVVSKLLNEGDEESVKGIYQLLKNKLSDNDYEVVKDITSRYINLDVAENY